MCSEFCPCTAVENNPWLDLPLATVTEKNRGGATTDSAPYPWVFGGKSYVVGDKTQVTDVAFEKEFSSFEACVRDSWTRDETEANKDFLTATKVFKEQADGKVDII